MSLEHLVQTLGLPGVVIGAALEGEGVAFLSGVFAHRHIFHFEAAALAVALGAVITDNVTFAIGRYGGGRETDALGKIILPRDMDPARLELPCKRGTIGLRARSDRRRALVQDATRHC